MNLNELGSWASIIGLFVAFILGFIGGRYSMKAKNIINEVDNKGGKISQK